MKEVNIRNIANLHTDALRALDFYKQDILILKKRLEEIAADNTGREVAEQVEYFQNQFLIQSNNIDELKHNLNQNLTKIEDQVRDSAGFLEQSTVDENASIYDQYLTLEKIVNDIRHQFNRFASRWM
jgi:hypothetical protein